MECINLIYITSTAYSGSTILGFILGSSPQIFNAGEIQYFNILQKKDEMCCCGMFSKQCPFWSDIYNHQYGIFSNPSFLKKLRMLMWIVLRKKISRNTLIGSDEYKLLYKIYENAKELKPEVNFIIDNSKSLWRLVYLIQCTGINVEVIFLKRDVFGNIGSFVKHKKGFLRGLFRYYIINYLIRNLLIINNINYFKIDYSKLCENAAMELDKVEKSLNINVKEYINKLILNNAHVPTGNMETRKSLENYHGLQLDDSWKERLSVCQKMVLKIVTSIFNQ